MAQAMERADGTRRRWVVLVFWLLVVAAVSAAGSAVTLPKIATWYAGLTKPSFTPPNAVFGPVWTALYILMAFSVWRIGTGDPERTRAIAWFSVQLALNAIWSPLFFGLEAPLAALVVLVALVATLATTMVRFWRLDRLAALLLVPYLAWTCYATALNAAIVALN